MNKISGGQNFSDNNEPDNNVPPFGNELTGCLNGSSVGNENERLITAKSPTTPLTCLLRHNSVYPVTPWR